MLQQGASSQTTFRPSALAKIRSPEQLDALLPITAPIGWIALSALGLALAAALFWGFTGTILRTTAGQGLIVRDSETGIMEVPAQASGVVAEVLVQVGDTVRAGQTIARFDLAQQKEQLESTRLALEKLREQDADQSRDEAARLDLLREKLANQQSLYGRGLITKTPLLETQSAIYEVNRGSYQRRLQLLDQESRLRELEIKYNQESVVRAAHDGRVIEVPVGPGNFIQPGRAVARLESLHGPYEAVIYVPAHEGKKVKEGMVVRLAPSTVKPEEYGYIMARVRWVSEYPVTRDYLMGELGGNESLVQTLLQAGSPIEFVAHIETDSTTPSGYRWSSSQGPDVAIGSGTICSASIVLESVRPITLLLPFLKKQTGIHW
jgi:HlyD family secretion protein